MPDLIVDSHIIASFRNRTNTLDAISELIDNSTDAGATTIALSLQRNEIIICDNGRGLHDLNVLFKPGASHSLKSSTSIGRYGIGAKEAMLHFGSFVVVESVAQGKYRSHEIDWDEVEKRGTPKPHSGNTIPLIRAPSIIRPTGTRITISRLSSGRARLYPDVLLKKLAHRYRPGIRKGKTYSVVFPGDLEPRRLSSDADILGLYKNEREIMGMATDRPFLLRYTDLKEYDLNLTGIHIGFGDRFIEHTKKLNGKTLPPLFYAEVMLSSKWKDCLSANKTSLIRFRDELEIAIHALAEKWIKELETFSDQVDIEQVNLLLEKHAEIFVFKQGDGPLKKGKKVKTTDPRDGPGPVNPDPNKDAHEAEDDDAGKGEKEKRKRKRTGLHFKRNDRLGKVPFEIQMDLAEHRLTVFLNGSIPAINIAYHRPYKLSALWPLISAAFSGWVRENIKGVEDYLPGFLEILRIAGYEVDLERADQLELYVLDWMMRQHPPTVRELEQVSAAA